MNESIRIEYIIVVIIASITSIFLIGGIISFFFAKSRTVVYELVLYISIATIFSMISYIIPWRTSSLPVKSTECIVQSFLMVIFEQSQFLWAMIIGYHISKGIKAYKGEKEIINMGRRFIYYLICFGYPLIFGIITYFLGQMGNSGMWCWITNVNVSGRILQWISFILAYGSAILNLSFSIRLIIYYHKQKSIDPEEAEIAKAMIYKLIRFPIIQIICIIPATINRLYNIITQERSVVLDKISIFFQCFQAAFIIITYWVNEGTLAYLTSCCKKAGNPDEKIYFRNNSRSFSLVLENIT